METTRIQNGKTERLWILLLDSDNLAVTGATVALKIRRKSDDYYWNGSAFQASATTVNMTEFGAGDAGKYYYDFVTAGLADDDYFITASSASGANMPQVGELKVGGYVNYIDAAISGLRLSLPMFYQQAGAQGGKASDSVWTKEEKDEIMRQVKEILDLTLRIEGNGDILEAQNQLREKIGEATGEMVGIILKEIAAVVEKQSEGILELKRFLQVHSETSLQANEAVKVEVIKEINSKVELIEKFDAKKLMTEILDKISLVEKIAVKQAPTQTLEEIQNEQTSDQ